MTYVDVVTDIIIKRPSGFAAFMSPLMSFMMRRANRKDLHLLKRTLEAD